MKFLVLLSLILSFVAHAQESVEKSFVFGTRGSYFTDSDIYQNALNFFHMKYRDERHFETSTLKTSFEFRVFDPITTNEDAFIDPVNVSLELMFNKTSFQAGFLRYRFSETFGLQILDVANPRDYSDFVLNDLSWAKRSVFGLNMQNRWDRLEALWMLTLWPNGDRLPYKGTPFDLTQGNFGYEGGVVNRPWFKDYEYGVRFKYLFENGLDLSVLGYHHFARPSLISISQTGPMSFNSKISSRMVNSLGMAGSFVMEDWVLRADILMTFDDNFVTGPISFEKKNHYQQLLGIDRLWENWTFGAQFQQDFAYKRNFIGGKIENGQFEFWKPSIMVFVSDKNSDQWIQIKNAFEHESWNMNVVFDTINGEENSDSLFGFYRKNDRVLFEIAKTY